MVVKSFQDDPVQLRDFRYVKPEAVVNSVAGRTFEQIALVVNDRHDIHHVRDRGYVESPVRVRSILAELDKSGLFTQIKPQPFPERHLLEVHATDFVRYLKRACNDVPAGEIPVSIRLSHPQQDEASQGAFGPERLLLHRYLYPH